MMEHTFMGIYLINVLSLHLNWNIVSTPELIGLYSRYFSEQEILCNHLYLQHICESLKSSPCDTSDICRSFKSLILKTTVTIQSLAKVLKIQINEDTLLFCVLYRYASFG